MTYAALGISVSNTGVAENTRGLDGLAVAADKVVKATDRVAPASQKAGSGVNSLGREARTTEGALERLSKQANGVEGALMRLATRAAMALGAAFSVQALVNYADAWSDMQSRVGAAVKDMEAAPLLMKRMVDLANASYSPLQQTVEVYTRNVGVLRDLGISAQGAADFTEALNHALVVTATRGERAASVQNALSKAMAVGKLQADGLETVLTNGGRVAEALAEELNTTVSGLRKLASEGKITGDVIARSLTDSLEDLRAEASLMPATIGDAFTRIQTNATALIGTFDQTMGISGQVANALLMVADNLDLVAAGGAGLATVLAVSLAPAIMSTVGAVAALTAALLTNPLTLLALAAGAAVTAIIALNRTAWELDSALTAAETGLRNNEIALNDAEAASVGYTAALRNQIAMQVEAARAAATLANAEWMGAKARSDWFKSTFGGATFQPFELDRQLKGISERKAQDALWELEQQLARVDANLQEVSTSAGGAGSSIAKAGKTGADALQELIKKSDQLAEKMFPGEYARREAEALAAALDQYGHALDEFQRRAVEAEIADLFKASELGVRRLEDQTKKSARNMADELKNTLGSILGDLFSKPIEDFDDFVDRVMSGLGQLGQANLSASMDLLFGNGDALGKAVEKGAKAGTEAGSAGGIFEGLASIFGGSGQNGGMMGVLGSAAGGLGIGYQTQDPMMGALGGALSGIAGGPLGIAAGAIGGFLGGLFGMNKALQEAQEKLAKVRGEIDSFIDVGEGRGVGQMTQAFRDYWDKSHEYQELAMKAGDGALQKRLQDAVNTFFLQLDKDFWLGFEGTLAALSSGQGLNGAFVSAQQQIVGLREELKAFIADTEYMGTKLGELASIDNAAEVAENLARARRAAQDHALSVLAGAEALTDMEKAALEAEGKASALQVTLEQLGMSAEEAASAITGALGMAMAKLRDEYARDINASINDLSGFGFLNEIVEAQAKYQERLRDASALGLDGASAMQELGLSLTGIARAAGLTQSQIDMLAQTFPAMAGMVEALVDNDAARRLSDAQAALRAAYEAQARALETTINRLDRFITSIQKFRDNLRLDDALSPLNPQERLIEAQRQFQAVMAQAMGGDEAALGRVEEVSRNYLEEARAYHGTSTQYFAIFEEVESLLDGVLASAKTQLSDAQRELALLQQQVGALIDINTSVLSVADAIANLAAAQAASDAALAAQLGQLAMANSNAISEVYKSVLGREADAGGLAYWSNQMNQGKSLGQVTDQISNSREAQIQQLYQSILGRSADASGLQYWAGSNKAISQIENELRYMKSIGHYADGGMHMGGLRIVGERGPELEATGPARIWTAQQTAGFLNPANGNSSAETLRELQALRQEIAQLRAERKQGDAVVAAGAQAQVAATGQATQEIAKQSNAAWKVANTRKSG